MTSPGPAFFPNTASNFCIQQKLLKFKRTAVTHFVQQMARHCFLKREGRWFGCDRTCCVQLGAVERNNVRRAATEKKDTKKWETGRCFAVNFRCSTTWLSRIECFSLGCYLSSDSRVFLSLFPFRFWVKQGKNDWQSLKNLIWCLLLIEARLTLQTDYCMFAADKTTRNKSLSLQLPHIVNCRTCFSWDNCQCFIHLRRLSKTVPNSLEGYCNP